MVRLRYKKSENGNLVSTQAVLIEGNTVRVTVNSSEFTFSIVSVENGELLTGGQANSLPHAKALAKLSLKDLGAVFHDEIRQKTVKLVDMRATDLSSTL